MGRALALARQGLGRTSPNPPVGAVLVKDGREIGRGFHRGPGQPHAEIEAFREARKAPPGSVRGATLYVTLEPCSTRGRTGACTEAIKREQVGTVVFGAEDPNPAHAGAAVALLREHGITVRHGVLEDECSHLIRAFRKVQTTGLPWVIAKTAMSLDGRITRPPGESQWLSGPAARRDVHQLRSEADAILTSGKTVREDNPALNVREVPLPEGHPQPRRVVLTSREDGVPADCQLLTDGEGDRTLVFAGRRLESVFRELASEHGISTILVEAGGRLLGRLVDEGWVDELVVYLTPLLTGGPDLACGGEGAAGLEARWGLTRVSFETVGEDLRLRGLLASTPRPLER